YVSNRSIDPACALVSASQPVSLIDPDDFHPGSGASFSHLSTRTQMPLSCVRRLRSLFHRSQPRTPRVEAHGCQQECLQDREDEEQVLLVAPSWPTRTWFANLMLLVTAPPWKIPQVRPHGVSRHNVSVPSFREEGYRPNRDVSHTACYIVVISLN
ncbi:hypothetical protein M9458_055873, partial [Cirrhinus mrigala]